MNLGLILSLTISSVILVIWAFLMYLIIMNSAKKDATKLIQMHIITFFGFFAVYTVTITLDTIYKLNIWKYRGDIPDNLLSKMSQGFYHTVIQHTTFGTSTVTSNSWLTRVFDIIHYSTSFFLNLSLFFEMLEETEEQGFNLFRAVGLKIGQIKNTMSRTGTRSTPITRNNSMSLKTKSMTKSFSKTPSLSLQSPSASLKRTASIR